MSAIRCVVVSLPSFPPEKSLKKFEAKFRTKLVQQKLLNDLDSLTVTLCPGPVGVCIAPQIEGEGTAKMEQDIRLAMLQATGL